MLAGGAGFATGGAGFGADFGAGWGTGFRAGWGFAAGGAAGAPESDDDEPLPCPVGRSEIWLPAADTANQAAPDAVRPCPLTSPGLWSLTNRYSGCPL